MCSNGVMKQSEGEQLNKVKPATCFCKGCHGYSCCVCGEECEWCAYGEGLEFNIPQCCFAASEPRKYEDLLKTVTVERIG